jgi:hypothetical protein
VRRVVITGIQGVIDPVISGRLSGWETRNPDVSECDMRDYDQVLALLGAAEAVLHLAWDSGENFLAGSLKSASAL